MVVKDLAQQIVQQVGPKTGAQFDVGSRAISGVAGPTKRKGMPQRHECMATGNALVQPR